MRVSLVYGLLAIVGMLVVQSDAVKCYIRQSGDVLAQRDTPEWGHVETEKQETCKGSCVSDLKKFEVDGKKKQLEEGTCNANGAENKITVANTEDIQVTHFQCAAELCNIKDSTEYKQANSLQNAVDKIALKLKGKSTNLQCYIDEKLATCIGLCVIKRSYTGVNADKTETVCEADHKLTNLVPDGIYKKNFGDYGLFVEVVFDGEIQKTKVTAYCSNNKCNEKESLAKEFDGFVTEVKKASVLTAAMPVLLVLSAVLNM